MSNRQLLRQLNAMNLGQPAPARRRRRRQQPRVVVVQQAPPPPPRRRRRNRRNTSAPDRYVGLGLSPAERSLLRGTQNSKVIITVEDSTEHITVTSDRVGQEPMLLGKWMRSTFERARVAAIEIRTQSVTPNGEPNDDSAARFVWQMGSQDLFCEWHHEHIVANTGPKDDDVWFFQPPADVAALEEHIDTSRLVVEGTFQLHLRIHYRQPAQFRVGTLHGGYTRDPNTWMDNDNKTITATGR
uniref:28 kDa protein n=1 Tax=Rice virus X TaxID=106518 RepID=Q9IR19_9TOMB|nr:28 kDa protein [Rice virus X]